MIMLQKGFTLLELMIVVAIIGILTLIAHPFYQDYVKRTYVAEGLQLASGIKTNIIEYYVTHGRLPDINDEDDGFFMLFPSKFIDFISLGGGSRPELTNYGFTSSGAAAPTAIEISFSPKIDLNGYGWDNIPASLYLEPYATGENFTGVSDPNLSERGSVLWLCYTDPLGHVWSTNYKYLPASCRQDRYSAELSVTNGS